MNHTKAVKENERNNRHYSFVPCFDGIGGHSYNCICFAVGFISCCEVKIMDGE